MKTRLMLLLGWLACPTAAVAAQGTQASAWLASRRASEMRDTLRAYRHRTADLLVALRTREEVHRGDTNTGAVALADSYGVAASRAEAALHVSGDDHAFLQALRALDGAMRELRALRALRSPDTGITPRADQRQDAVINAWGPVPVFLHTLSPKVAFSAGLGSTFPLLRSRATSIDIGTNLAGSILGKALESVGLPAGFKDFLTENTAVGLGFSAHRRVGLTTSYSVGLGSADVAGRAIWPILAIQQSDTATHEINVEARTTDTLRAVWSRPYVALGFTLYDRATVTKRLQDDKVVPVFTIGVQLPYLYPGDASTALAALFTEKRGKYLGAGRARLVVGVSIPLIRLEKPPSTASR